MARPAVDDAVSAILDAYGYPRENGWHHPDSVLDVIYEEECWTEETAPGACMVCFDVSDPPLRPACKCGGEIRSILSLAGEI